jgi:hypothetical protein
MASAERPHAAAPPPDRWRRRRLALAVSATFLALQAVAGLKLLSPPERFAALAPLRVAPNPKLWPFLAYDMYTQSWPEGRAIARPRVVGIDTKGMRHDVTPESVGLGFRTFRDDWMNPLRGGAREKATPLAARFAERCGIALVELRCENVPAIVDRSGIVDGEIVTERRYDLAREERR